MTDAPSVTCTHCDSVRVRTRVPLLRTFVLDMKDVLTMDGVWSWNTCESGRQNSFIHVVVLQAYWWCWMVFGHGIHMSPADRILLHMWWSSKLIVGGVGWCLVMGYM